ncbi:MAG: amidohydrolase, partial [Ilumatobacteraceae bacterium]
MNELLLHGRIATADPEQPWAEAVLVRGERIEFVGPFAEAQALSAAGCEVVDIGDGVALPGFVDAHAHLLSTGASLLRAQLRTARSLDEIGDALRAWIAANPDADTVLGISWLFDAVPNGMPTRQMLDAIEPDKPVYLDANDLHSVWCNTAALQQLGITDATPDPVGGRIVRDQAGAASGLLLENAGYHIAWPVMNTASEAEYDRQLQAAIGAYLAAGTTAAVDMALDGHALRTMVRAAERGQLPFTLRCHWLINRTGNPEEELAQVAAAAHHAAAHGEGPVQVVGIKLIADGTIDGCTAGMLLPFTNGEPGELIWDAEALTRVVVAADEAGLQIAIHAIGDLAVRTALDAFEVAAQQRAERGDTAERRHRIEHLEYADAADIARLAPLGITASMQPVHCDPAIMGNWATLLGPERAHEGFAWPAYLAHGTTLAFGTDTPTAPYEPLPNMYIAATRSSPDDSTAVPHRPDFALPLPDAIGHGTREAAWASFMEHERGMLRAGLAADIVVLDRDPFALGPNALLPARVVRTMVGGRTVVGG